MSETNKTKRYIQAAAFVLFIIGLPLGSWYYLQAGFDYNKDLMSELKDYGRVPEFELVDQNGKKITRKELEGKIVVVNFFNRTEASYSKTMDYLRRMHKQFDDRSDLIVLSHSLELESTDKLKSIAQKEQLDNAQNRFVTASEAALTKLMANGYQVPDISKRKEDKTIPRDANIIKLPENYPYFILLDVSGTIRNYYDINDESAVTRMVEHIAIILPRKAEEKAELIRETEK